VDPDVLGLDSEVLLLPGHWKKQHQLTKGCVFKTGCQQSIENRFSISCGLKPLCSQVSHSLFVKRLERFELCFVSSQNLTVPLSYEIDK
jgi:hypothetical protein